MRTTPALLLASCLVACGGEGTLKLSLTDAPLDGATAVNVAIDEVAVHHAGGGAKGWEVVSDEDRTFNLLELQNGVTAALGSATLAEGKVTQLRLVLAAAGHSLVNGAGEHALTIPSGEETGVKLTGCFEVVAGETLELTVDFEADASVSGDDASGYTLRPVIKLVDHPDCQGSGEDE